MKANALLTAALVVLLGGLVLLVFVDLGRIWEIIGAVLCIAGSALVGAYIGVVTRTDRTHPADTEAAP